ncbi:MAG: type II secretion system protein [Alphaproteobacteria bacterium]|nr:type II secretion system protein [Alphaproteobacteria bacterium]
MISAPSYPPKTCHRQRGYGLLELMIAITMASVLIAGAFLVFRNMRDQQATDAQVRQINQLITALQKTYGMVSFTGLSDCSAGIAAILPPELIDPTNACPAASGGQSASHSMGGHIGFNPVASGAQMELVWSRVPASLCADLVVGVQALANRIQISGEARTGTPPPTVQPQYKEVKASGGALSMASLGEWCSAEETTNSASPAAPAVVNKVSRVDVKFTITR